MSKLRFGTDGIRAVADRELTSRICLALGHAIADVLKEQEVILLRDTRISSPRIAAAIAAGLAECGKAVRDVGVLPTPAAAFLALELKEPAVVISASHNPYHFNGVKVFDAAGMKLSESSEVLIETYLDKYLSSDPKEATLSAPIYQDGEKSALYRDWLYEAAGRPKLKGLKVVLDCAHGATFKVAPELFRMVGAEVVCAFAQPSGTNINEGCGALYPHALSQMVVAEGADLGLAFDGDGDRVIAIDEKGGIRDGDFILAVLAKRFKEAGERKNQAVAATVMSNLGLVRALEREGLRTILTPVGDRHVLKAIEEHGLSLGGEQSGHVIIRSRTTTGDGLLVGLYLASIVRESGSTFSSLADSVLKKLPQVITSVAVEAPTGDVLDALSKELESLLSTGGRVLLRPSGTEPVVRIMVEAEDAEEAQRVASLAKKRLMEARGCAG